MKKFRRKALPALTMLVIAILCLTGVTYAWFTEGSNVEVKDIKVTVTSSTGGMLISSTQNGSYKNSFSASGESATLTPVSTAGERINGSNKGLDSMNFFTAVIDNSTGNSLTSAAAVSSKTGNYIQFEIWFESLDSADKNVYFDYTDASDMFVLGTNETISEAASALRIAFVYQGTKESKSSTAWVDYYSTTDVYNPVSVPKLADIATYYQEKFVAATGSSIDGEETYYTFNSTTKLYESVAEPVAENIASYFVKVDDAYELTNDAALVSGKSYYTKLVTNNVDELLTDTSNPIIIVEPQHDVHNASGIGQTGASQTQQYYGLKHYFSVNAATAADTPADGKSYDWVLQTSLVMDPGNTDPTGEAALIYKKVTTKTVDQCMATATSDKTALFQLHQGYTHVTVYIWIEGQDIDCTNAIANLFNTISLKFVAENVTANPGE